MTPETPKHILCAVRSRPGGEETVNQAIELALEHQARLTFFQVIDARFMRQARGRRGGSLKAVYNELAEMAEFAMSLMCTQAEQRGVAAVDYVVRQGDIRQELPKLIAEMDVDVLVMGRPKRSPGRSIFKRKELDSFVARLEETGKLRVVQVQSTPGNKS